MTVTDARALAVRAHGEQCDRDGHFHIDHVARVAAGVTSTDSLQRVAWLHDVIEDSDTTLDDLRGRLPEAELDALTLLTHRDAIPYADYVEAIIAAPGEAGELARAVKESDMLDNLRRCATDHDPAIVRYGTALGALWTAHGRGPVR